MTISDKPSEEQAVRLRAAEKLGREGRHAEAIDVLESLVRENPMPLCLKLLRRELSRAGRHRDAAKAAMAEATLWISEGWFLCFAGALKAATFEASRAHDAQLVDEIAKTFAPVMEWQLLGMSSATETKH